MKKIVLMAVSGVLFSTLLVAQSVGINNTTPDASAILDVTSSTKGMLIPRTSTTSRLAIANPAKGLTLYDTTTSSFWFHNGSAWVQIGAANGWALTGNAATNPATNFLGTTDNLPLRFKVNNTWAGEIHPTSDNIFLGLGAGQANTTAGKNIAIGTGALQTQSFNYGGETNNVAIGFEALNLNNPSSTTNGISNTAVGSFALRNNTIGYDNTAVGTSALYYNQTGKENTAIGRQALFSNINGFANTATGYKALRFTDNGNYNTANGYSALYSNSSGWSNTANGAFALSSNTTAGYNTAIGVSALASQSFNNGGSLWISNNVAVGYQALFSNQPTSTVTGINNTAVGVSALYSNTTGINNTANGYQALYNNTDGYYNTAVGQFALYNNIGGYYNTAIGQNALLNNTGAFADRNTAVGTEALKSNTTGLYNTAVGSNADNDLPSANYNTLIGTAAHCSASNSVVIGYGSFTNTNNLALLGNPTTLFTGGYTAWSNFSDGRFKKDIDETVKGLDFIMRLRPVTYHMDVRGLYNFWGISPYGKEENKMTAAMKTDMDNNIHNKEAVRMSGFVAQEVEKAAKASNYDFDGVIPPTHDKDHYRIAYGEFVVPLVKAVQELSEKTTAQNKIIEQQQNKITLQQQQYEMLLKRVEALEKKN